MTMSMEVAALVQRDIDDLNLIGLSEDDGFELVKTEFPSLKVFVAERSPIIRDADLYKLTFWLDENGLIKAAMHG